VNRTNFYLAICTLSLMTSGSARCIHAAEKDDVANEPIVTASGTGSITRPTNLLYFDARIVAQGATVQEAVNDLRERRAQFLKSFEPLGSDKGSLEIGTMKRWDVGGADVEPPITLSLSVRAQWTLNSADAEELLLEADALEAKIKAAELGWSKSFAHQAARGNGFVRRGREALIPEPGLQDNPVSAGERTRVFHYGATPLSEEERTELLATTFEKAKASADELARAAGRRLGNPRTLKAEGTVFHSLRNSSSVPGEIRPFVSVTATFDLLPAVDK
jgi:hypothetical protein